MFDLDLIQDTSSFGDVIFFIYDCITNRYDKHLVLNEKRFYLF